MCSGIFSLSLSVIFVVWREADCFCAVPCVFLPRIIVLFSIASSVVVDAMPFTGVGLFGG